MLTVHTSVHTPRELRCRRRRGCFSYSRAMAARSMRRAHRSSASSRRPATRPATLWSASPRLARQRLAPCTWAMRCMCAAHALPRCTRAAHALHALHTRCARAARSACSVHDASSHMQTAHSMQPHAALRCMPGRSQRKSNGPTGRPTLTAAAGRGSSRRRHGPRG